MSLVGSADFAAAVGAVLVTSGAGAAVLGAVAEQSPPGRSVPGRAAQIHVVSLSDRQLASVARRAGCWHGDQLVTAVAVALAESGGRTGARGDVRIQTGTWGPSVGLWQIRSLRAERGTGGVRDERANRDPAKNAAHACSLWRGQGWRPWSTWRNGTHRTYLPRARAALR